MWSFFLRGAVLGGVAAFQPGPFQAYLLSQTLVRGWRRSVMAAFAPLLSDGPILTLVLIVLTKLPPQLLIPLQIVGGVFLLYLAWKAFQTLNSTEPTVSVEPESSQKSVVKAALVNLLNPNPYIFWATISGPIVIEGWRNAPRFGLAFLFGFYGLMISGLVGLITLFAAAKRLDPKVNKALLAASFAALTLFGLYQLWTGLSELLSILS